MSYLQDIIYMGWVGVLVALSVSVGKYIGAGNVPSAKKASIAGGLAGALLGAVAGLLISWHGQVCAMHMHNYSSVWPHCIDELCFLCRRFVGFSATILG